MNYVEEVSKGNFDRGTVKKLLDESLDERDFYCRKSRNRLIDMGVEKNAALMLLALHKSNVKYDYSLASDSLRHLFELAQRKEKKSPLKKLLESPLFLMKAGWIYEHAPFFFYYDDSNPENRDSLILDFTIQYENNYLNSNASIQALERAGNPRRVKATTFWESKIFDPVLQMAKAIEDNIEGLELNFDFHPFNYTKLLPEDLSAEKRKQIREASLKKGVKLDIHSPIIGPYTPSPDPSTGKQRFFDPTDCIEIQYETIDLAKDIGAECVVVHLIDTSNLKKMASLIERAGGSDVRVTVENYTYTKDRQDYQTFLSCLQEIFEALPKEIREHNFGVTLDVGHFNIEGDDPLVAAERIGKWCLENGVFIRMHATDNYGDLLFSPPAYSADVHGNVAGRGINNALIIKMLRSMGLQFDVTAEQISPLTPEDIDVIHEAQTCALDKSYSSYCRQGKKKLSQTTLEELIGPETIEESVYQFIAGFHDIPALKEHLLYRKIQSNKNLSVDEARKISQEFIRMPLRLKNDLTEYIDDFLSFIQGEYGSIKKRDFDLVCQNISGALFTAISNEHLNNIFSQNRTLRKGDVICQQKTHGQEMYFIKKGEVIANIDGACVASLGPGEIFGEMSLFYNIDRSATIVALKDETVVGILTRRDLENLFKSSQPHAHDLIFRFYNILPARLRHLNEKYKTAIQTLYLVCGDSDEELLDFHPQDLEIIYDKADYFPTLTYDEAIEIFPQITHFEKDQYIFREGEQGDSAYFIIDGKVKVTASTLDQKEVLLAELNKGEIFGEMALIDEKPRSANVVTQTPCKIASVNKKELNSFIQSRSELAIRLMGFVCLSLFRSILRLDKLYSDIKRKIRHTERAEPGVQ
ncbi:cyclic nucleotide-binding domain-containing protein [Thermodesulfobacteriota bacterium]